MKLSKQEGLLSLMNTLAEKFRLKRKELRLSQQTLAEGICEQS